MTAAVGEETDAPKMMGSLSCSSVSCHGGQIDNIARPRPREEYVRWLQDDPHAQARATLQSDRFQTILSRASQRADGKPDPKMQARCNQCHDPVGMAAELTANHNLGHGISCESCHGNAEKWITRHYERDVNRAELLSLGMLDTKNLHTRGKACASCHVGSADQDMNHDMIAAGHPPLRYELTAFHDLIRHKHWDDSPERLQTRDFQVQLWAAGQVAGAQASLELLEARCGSVPERWPEFAEYNCFACHQRFRVSSSLLVAKRDPGRPDWSRWHLTFVESLQAADRSADNDSSLQTLRTIFSETFPPKQSQVLAASAAARRRFNNLTPDESFSAEKLLLTLSTSLSNPTGESDWETRSQQFLALVAAERTYRDELAKAQFFARLGSEEYNRRLTEHESVVADLTLVRTWLQFEGGSAKSVLSDEPQQFHEHRQELGPQLKTIADKMHGRMLLLK
ncbi:multiheme c-type cytochrome [Anatilimnocola aggregata]|nr:multiheme c-type cytochrome [Anatilimnocola aggregata]